LKDGQTSGSLPFGTTAQEWKQPYLESIFQPFVRLHGQQSAAPGLGLAICRVIVERHGGRIWAESAPGAGATFLFTLPAE
jgi:signal transduction histidine kinase